MYPENAFSCFTLHVQLKLHACNLDPCLCVHTDAVLSVEIVPPSQVFNSEVPATISLLFSATVTSQHNTGLLDIREYQWDFGDGTPPSSSAIPTVSHTYSTSGTYTVSLTVHAPFVSGSGEDSLDLIVYEGEWIEYLYGLLTSLLHTLGPYHVNFLSFMTNILSVYTSLCLSL